MGFYEFLMYVCAALCLSHQNGESLKRFLDETEYKIGVLKSEVTENEPGCQRIFGFRLRK